MKANPERLFIYRLARELGYTIKRLLSETDSRDIAEWMAFFSLEAEELEAAKKPKPEILRDKLRATLEAYSHGNSNRSRKPANKDPGRSSAIRK